MAKERKKIIITLPFDEEKYRALVPLLDKKSFTLEDKMLDYLTKLYEKTVPKKVREFIENDPKTEQNTPEKRSQDKGGTPKDPEYPQNTPVGSAYRE